MTPQKTITLEIGVVAFVRRSGSPVERAREVGRLNQERQ